MATDERKAASDRANLDATRIVTLVGTNVAIFTFLLFFLYPRYQSGDIDSFLFQATLALLGLAVFSLVFAGLFFYAIGLPGYLDSERLARIRRSGDLFWIMGYTLFLLEPTLILLTVRLYAPAAVWLALWAAYVLWSFREYGNLIRASVR